MDNKNYLYSDYLEDEKTLTDYVLDWVDGDDLQYIRDNHSNLFYTEILKGKMYPILYRYIEKKSKHQPLYKAEVGDTIVYDLISTTTSTPREAWDEWFDEYSNVILIKNAKGIDVNDFGADKFSWEKEIITCGSFKFVNKKEKTFKGNSYILYEVEYIENKELQEETLNNLLIGKAT